MSLFATSYQKVCKVLFDRPDFVYTGSAYGTGISSQFARPGEFFCINPISQYDHEFKRSFGRRADINVKALRNFLFEMDRMPLEEQLMLIKNCGIPWSSVTYSGGKSYHAILSFYDLPASLAPHTSEGVRTYKHLWKQLALYISQKMGHDKNLFDSSCQNPSRLSRTPGYLRDGKTEQSLISLGKREAPTLLYELLAANPVPSAALEVEFTEEDLSEGDLKLKMPVELYNRLKFPAVWASDVGNYPELLKLILWMIDSTHASKATVKNFLTKHTFPALMELGYPEEKLLKPVEHAFNMKHRRG